MSSESSGAANNAADSGANGGQDNTQRTVAFEDHKRALDDLHKFKTQAREYESKLSELQTKLESRSKEELEGQGNFKTLYEQEKQARAELEKKYGGLKESITYNEKFKAANAALAKAGLRPEALKILERESLEALEVEATSQGRFLVHGVDLFVDNFKKSFPFAFQDQKPPTVNSGGGASGSMGDDELTPAYMVKLEKTDRAKYLELLPKFLEQRKKKMAR